MTFTTSSERYGNTVTYSYTDDSLLSSENLTAPQITNPNGYTIVRGYDADDRLTNITYPNSVQVSRTYTARDQLDTVTRTPGNGVPPVQLAAHTYDPALRETSRALGNGLTRITAYTRQDHLPTAMTVANRPGLSWSTYTYDGQKRCQEP